MHLIVGLGNPGRPYRRSRHNVGFMLVDRFADQLGEKVERLSGRSLVCSTSLAGSEIILAKPQTYMNLSGLAVRELVENSQLALSRCLVIYDEISLSLGRMRLRPSGGAGGHKGMQSILRSLGTEQIPRLRIGIGGETPIGDLTSFVLGRFSKDELVILEEVLEECTKALESFLIEGIERAMTGYNKREG